MRANACGHETDHLVELYTKMLNRERRGVLGGAPGAARSVAHVWGRNGLGWFLGTEAPPRNRMLISVRSAIFPPSRRAS